MRSSRLGAIPGDNGVTRFVVWAPFAKECSVRILSGRERAVQLQPLGDGYYGADVSDCGPGALYMYRLNGSMDRPDPASTSQPRGVHGPSMVTRRCNDAGNEWQGLDMRQYVIYELHIGTFTAEGTLDAAIRSLGRLQELGVTAIEVMPVAEFPGGRNWGYDGVYPYAVERRYGGIDGLRRFVRACHERDLAFILDVVYNHLGPEGNYLRDFGPYFTDRHKTPWGEAINFDGPHSDHVRRYFIENALHWIDGCGVDALRLDAVHAIHDESAYPFLQELADRVHARGADLGRAVYLIAESDLNDARLVSPAERGGIGLDGQWADDFHHGLHTLLTGESNGYYADFGSIEQFAKAIREGWTYSGDYSVVRQRRFGNSPAGLQPSQLVVCSQNHDQVGNRMNGERLLHLTDWDTARLAAAAVILSPYIPLLFMGEEYGEPAPFLYHVSHSDLALQDAVRAGRRNEFAEFLASGEPPDPQDEETFRRSKLHQELACSGAHGQLHRYYQRLLELRRSHPALQPADERSTVTEVCNDAPAVLVRRLASSVQALVYLHFGREEATVISFVAKGEWEKVLDSWDPQWGGPGSRVPCRLTSSGEPRLLTLPPISALVFSGAVP
jgi:maltooligosyltrehalose trehalohydrolase